MFGGRLPHSVLHLSLRIRLQALMDQHGDERTEISINTFKFFFPNSFLYNDPKKKIPLLAATGRNYVLQKTLSRWTTTNCAQTVWFLHEVFFFSYSLCYSGHRGRVRCDGGGGRFHVRILRACVQR